MTIFKDSELKKAFDDEDIPTLVTFFHQAEQHRQEASRSQETEEKQGTYEEPADEQSLHFGPLIKSKDTVQLEKLFRHIIANDKMELKVHQGEYIITLKRLVKKNKEFNLSKILKHANLNHIVLTDKDMSLFEKYLKKQFCHKFEAKDHDLVQNPEFVPESHVFPNPSHLNSVAKASAVEQLTYPEKLAINVYSNEFYKFMNALLRGEIIRPKKSRDDFLSECIEKDEDIKTKINVVGYEDSSSLTKDGPLFEEQSYLDEVKFALIYSIMVSSGLNRVAQSSSQVMLSIKEKIQAKLGLNEPYTQVSFRTEDTNRYYPGELENRIAKTQTKNMAKSFTFERGFVSTSLENKSITHNLNVRIFIVGPRGQDISPIAYYPDESELLMPPTQMCWVYHQEIENIHYFFAKPICVLNELTPESCEAPQKKSIASNISAFFRNNKTGSKEPMSQVLPVNGYKQQ